MRKNAFLIVATLVLAQSLMAGTPFGKGNHSVPSRIEAEDYDLGGENVGYKWGTASNSNKSYRSDAKGIDAGSDRSNGYNLGFTDGGVWTNYTIQVSQSGDYSIAVNCSAGGDNAKFALKIDGKQVSKYVGVAKNGWGNYSDYTVTGIHLTQGEHVFTWVCLNGGMNCDYFTFTRTGDLSVDPSQIGNYYVYPQTQTYSANPLFVNFPSPMYGAGEGDYPGVLYTADPSARVWNVDGRDVLYVYASHDMEPAVGCDRMDRYHVFSTEDMKTWTDHGEIISAAQVNEQFKGEFPYCTGTDDVQFMWAPDCMYNPNDQTFYYYFPHAVAWKGKNGAPETVWKIFVATSKNPATGFKTVGYLKNAVSYIDPNVFLDDDGTLYFYQGGGSHLFGGKFKKGDWTQLDGTPKEMTFNGKSDFHEGAWVFKRNGKYYLTYPDNHSPAAGGNQLRYAVSDSPLGPWTEKGVYMYPHGEETAHGSVVEFKGKWYQFYHTGNYSGEGTLRSVCVDELTFAADGSINVVRNWGTPKGGVLPQLGSKEVIIEAENFNDGGSHYGYFIHADNGDIQVVADGDVTYVAGLTNKEWTRYSVTADEGQYQVKIRIRQRNNTNSKLTFAIDGTWVKTAELGSTRNDWQEITLDGIEFDAGEHYIELRNAGGDTDIDYIKIGVRTAKPLTIEAEDFDQGGEGVAYHWSNTTGGQTYRSDASFATSSNIGWTSNGDWCNYTINVPTTGKYKLTAYVSSGLDNGGSFRLKLDGSNLTDIISVSNTGWDTYKQVDYDKEITLTAGKHVLQFYCYGGMNADKFVFQLISATDIQAAEAEMTTPQDYYTISGVRVPSPLRPGIYIHQGKKVLIK